MFMILNSRRLNAMVLIAGVLVVGLGLYIAFQPEEAEATHSSLLCLFRLHRVSGTSHFATTMGSTGRTFPIHGVTCSRPGCKTRKTHTYKEYKQKNYTFTDYEHASVYSTSTPPYLALSWSYCHMHTSTSYSTYWKIERCAP